jgi:hypothetical protein
MKAGPEMDALVAEKMLGWRWMIAAADGIDSEPHSAWLMRPESVNAYWIPARPVDDYARPDADPFSTEIAAAWQVVEHLHHQGVDWTIDQCMTGEATGWTVQTWRGSSIASDAWADTAPLAICLAGLKAVGVDLDALVGPDPGPAEVTGGQKIPSTD